MEIDYILGNPPYQISDGTNTPSASPIYQCFSDIAKHISIAHCLIQPARWMIGGKGLDSYRSDMMHDCHIRAIDDFANSKDVFLNVDIKGGVMIYIYDNRYDGLCHYTRYTDYGATSSLRSLYDDGCDIVIRENVLVGIFRKVVNHPNIGYMNSICSSVKSYGLSGDVFGREGKYNLPAMSDRPIQGGFSILGLDPVSKRRTTRYVPADYPFPKRDNLNKYKLFMAEAYGRGRFGEPFSTPVIASPGMACTGTFIEIGPFDTECELDCLHSYVRTKFFRALIGIRKQTQHANRSVYSFVPLQDFTPESDIDWSLPVPQIDSQLYSKYGFTAEEIDFIEKHVQPMD